MSIRHVNDAAVILYYKGAVDAIEEHIQYRMPEEGMGTIKGILKLLDKNLKTIDYNETVDRR